MGYIYALIDPRTSLIRYIGKTTKKPKDRLKNHLSHRNTYDYYPVYRWIRNLVRERLMPKIVVLEETDCKHLDTAEIKWIAKTKELFPLLNISSGGEGFSGEQHWKARLTERGVIEIRKKYRTGKYTTKDLAQEYLVKAAAIYKVLVGQTWGMVNGVLSVEEVNKIGRNLKVRGKGKTPITISELEEMLKLRREGYTYQAIADKLDISLFRTYKAIKDK